MEEFILENQFQCPLNLPKISCIYQIIYCNGKSYVGRAMNLRRRMKKHFYRNEAVCDKAIKKHRVEKIVILEENLTYDELLKQEPFWIKEKNSKIDKNGYNLTDGGKDSAEAGEKSFRAMFTNEEVNSIRIAKANGERKKDVFEKYSRKTYSAFCSVWKGAGYPDVDFQEKRDINRRYYVQGYKYTLEEIQHRERQVSEIRQLYIDGLKPREILERYKDFFNIKQIWAILNKETWKDVEPLNYTYEKTFAKGKVTFTQVKDIRKRFENKESEEDILKLYPQLNHRNFLDIVNYRTYKNI